MGLTSVPTTRPKLPVLVSPSPDETLTSWLVRLAAANRTRTRVLGGWLLGRPFEFNRDWDGLAGQSIWLPLSERTGTPVEVIEREHTFIPFAGVLFPRLRGDCATPWILPSGTGHSQRRAMQFCPPCLASGAYFRRRWRLSLLTVCSTHQCRLLDACPGCSAPIVFARTEVSQGFGFIHHCYRCGFDLRAAPCPTAEPAEVTIGSALERSLQSGTAPPNMGDGPGAAEFFEALGCVCSRLLRCSRRLKAWRELAAGKAGVKLPLPSGRGHASTHFDSLRSVEARSGVLRAAWWLLEDWPARFVTMARAARTRSSDFISVLQESPEWFRQPLRTVLSPPQRKEVPGPPRLRARRLRDAILENRRLWPPTKQPTLARTLRRKGIYGPDVSVRKIISLVQPIIERLHREGGGPHLRMTHQIARGTQEWSGLLAAATPYRKIHCSSSAKLRRGIILLCRGRFLSARDLGDLLHRSPMAIRKDYLCAMVKEGSLRAKFTVAPTSLARAGPAQAYISVEQPAEGPSPERPIKG